MSRAMALAACAQAVSLVQKIARQGSCDMDDFYAVVKGVLVTNPQVPADVYAGGNLDTGYRLVIELLGDTSSRKDPELTRYLIGLLALERRLAKRRDVLALMGERIEQVKRQVSHYGIEDEKVLNNLADIYVELISPWVPASKWPDPLSICNKASTNTAYGLPFWPVSALWCCGVNWAATAGSYCSSVALWSMRPANP